MEVVQVEQTEVQAMVESSKSIENQFDIVNYSKKTVNTKRAVMIRLFCVALGLLISIFCIIRATASWYDEYIYDVECNQWDPYNEVMSYGYGYECYVTKYKSFDIYNSCEPGMIFCSGSRNNFVTHVYGNAPNNTFGQNNLLWIALALFVVASCLPYQFNCNSIKISECNPINYVFLLLLSVICILQILAIIQVKTFQFDCSQYVGDKNCHSNPIGLLDRNWKFMVIAPIIVMMITSLCVPSCVNWLQNTRYCQNRTESINYNHAHDIDAQEGREIL